MTRLLRSKSYTFGRVSASNSSVLDLSPRCSSLYDYEEVGDEEEGEDGFLSPEQRQRSRVRAAGGRQSNHNNPSPILAVVVAALRKSLVTCSVDRDDVANMDIGWPTDVCHVSHVTFDRFDGFLGLPIELQPEVPRKVPSASVSVFGVSVQSMQCSYDLRGNSVPTILLKLQSRLYTEGGLQAEGIFRINAENSQEETVRSQLNRGIVPYGIDVHCLAGLIKAWFRELPTGVLDSLTPEQVMHCNTEEDCTQLVNLLPPTEAALLDWAINLMADVVHNEHYNKMNARNVAMVFAPNMTQMADPLTALIHAVQVMNLLKTLIMKTLREREESHVTCQIQSSCANISSCMVDYVDGYSCEKQNAGKLSRSATLDGTECESGEQFWNCKSTSDAGEECDSVVRTSPVARRRQTLESRFREGFDTEEGENTMIRLNLRKGMQKLYRHPVFQLSKPVKKSRLIGTVNSSRGGGEALA
ncbi:rho GTPase-activating protein 5 [Nicotiana tomentosiformis]|uniref:rho GTPase-activating protein 5 n=1 Tax=Nicotiana tomentosiformis TaxID=4098 RepID=UPI00051C4F97|nr:rho GTPase-activating protein 5 [Nicotiana tomentosiformis]